MSADLFRTRRLVNVRDKLQQLLREIDILLESAGDLQGGPSPSGLSFWT